jgi:hypothetical protein
MGAWQYVATMGTTRIMHRGYRHEEAGGSGRERVDRKARSKSPRWIKCRERG